MLTQVGLDDVMHKRIKALSGGMRRRVILAQALLGRARAPRARRAGVGSRPRAAPALPRDRVRRRRAPHGAAVHPPDRGRRRAVPASRGDRPRSRSSTTAPPTPGRPRPRPRVGRRRSRSGCPGVVADLDRPVPPHRRPARRAPSSSPPRSRTPTCCCSAGRPAKPTGRSDAGKGVSDRGAPRRRRRRRRSCGSAFAAAARPLHPPRSGPSAGAPGRTGESCRRWPVPSTRAVLRHPAFLAGAALTPLMLWAATADTAFGSAPDWRDISLAIALALVPLAWLTIVAVDLVALRPRRTGADELFAALPTPQPVRTTALLAAAIGPVDRGRRLACRRVGVVATRDEVQGIAALAGDRRRPAHRRGRRRGGRGRGPVAAARGLRRPRRRRHHVHPGALPRRHHLAVESAPRVTRSRFLGFIAEATSAGAAALEVRPSGWHLLYLVGLVVVDGRGRARP